MTREEERALLCLLDVDLLRRVDVFLQAVGSILRLIGVFA